MDRLIALIVIICISPLLLILLIVTMIDLKCNPIFSQKRTVNGESEFVFYKLRSMHKDAPVVPTAEFEGAQKYISRWGSFVRMYSLDELFNLICIIKGDMNFIGPRPIMSCEVYLLGLRINNNIKSKPGLTGLAQVNGRDLITLKRKVVCERYYEMKKKSIMLRISILLKTVEIVFRKSGITH
jgi:O-antigen biosynthesis protein WbqP